MRIGDKILVNETYKEYCVTKARKGMVGTIKNFIQIETFVDGLPSKLDGILFTSSKGEDIEIPLNFISLYQKEEKLRIESFTNEDLVERLVTLSAHEPFVKMGSQKRLKMNEDIKRCEKEILKRMK